MQDPKLKYAVEIDDASFTWDGPPPDLNESKEDKEVKKSRSDPALNPYPCPNRKKSKKRYCSRLQASS